MKAVLSQVDVEIVRRSDQAKGFVVLPKRWVVERTLAWLNRCRRLSKDWVTSTARRRRSCSWLPFASWSEGYAGPSNVSGQTLTLVALSSVATRYRALFLEPFAKLHLSKFEAYNGDQYQFYSNLELFVREFLLIEDECHVHRLDDAGYYLDVNPEMDASAIASLFAAWELRNARPSSRWPMQRYRHSGLGAMCMTQCRNGSMNFKRLTETSEPLDEGKNWPWSPKFAPRLSLEEEWAQKRCLSPIAKSRSV